MKLLFTAENLFSAIGGGQTAYQNIFSRNRETLSIAAISARQKQTAENVELIAPAPVCDAIKRQAFIEAAKQLGFNNHDLSDFIRAKAIAKAAAGRRFDIVEAPDFESYLRFLPAALEKEGVAFEKLVLSLHGRLSYSLRQELPSRQESLCLDEMSDAETDCLRVADIRYAISKQYGLEQERLGGLPVELIDPLLCLPESLLAAKSLKALPADSVPQFVSIGRLDRTKGYELLLQAAWRCGEKLAKPLLFIGDDSCHYGRRASSAIADFAESFGVRCELAGPVPKAKLLEQLASSPLVVAAPSRFDSFNLTVLEGILSGCPAIVSKACGAFPWLEENFPKESFAEFNLDNPLQAVEAMLEMQSSYASRRNAIAKWRASSPLKADSNSILAVYAAKVSHCDNTRKKAKAKFDVLDSLLLEFLDGPKQRKPANPFRQAVARVQVNLRLPEASEQEIALKAAQLRMIATEEPYVMRTALFRELAKLEGRLGSPLLEAAYNLRTLRWDAQTHRAALPKAIETLESCKLGESAKAAQLMFGEMPEEERDKRIFDYLETRRKGFFQKPAKRFEQVLDRRKSLKPKVSVIVSMYAVPERQLHRFLADIASFTMTRSGQAEVLFIDSASPENPIPLIDRALDSQLSFAVMRTPERESIQMAWNRGLVEARGEYLCFLGTDESLAIDALERLSEHLDSHPETDWVMADASVLEVDANGDFLSLKMAYDRKGLDTALCLRDCCAFAYVGGLYRASVHEKAGLYDPSFRGAGDTEFKCRAFPFIKIDWIPGRLGLFLDYPAERTTASCHTEIEDLRAWHLFHSKGGLRYLLRNVSDAELERAAIELLARPRTYISHPESDASSAAIMLELLKERGSNSPLPALAEKLSALQSAIMNFKDPARSGLEPESFSDILLEAHCLSKDFFASMKTLAPDMKFPPGMLYDAQFSAHGWVWPVKRTQLSESFAPGFAFYQFDAPTSTNNLKLEQLVSGVNHARTIRSLAISCDESVYLREFWSLWEAFRLQSGKMPFRWLWKLLEERLRRSGREGFAFYGAGKHTKRFLEEQIVTKEMGLKWIIDDNPKASSLLGVPVVLPSELPLERCEAIILSSDTFEATLAEKAGSHFSGKIDIIALYDSSLDLPEDGISNFPEPGA